MINWELRQIGKRNPILNRRAIEVSHQIKQIDSSHTASSSASKPLVSKITVDRHNGSAFHQNVGYTGKNINKLSQYRATKGGRHI